MGKPSVIFLQTSVTYKCYWAFAEILPRLFSVILCVLCKDRIACWPHRRCIETVKNNSDTWTTEATMNQKTNEVSLLEDCNADPRLPFFLLLPGPSETAQPLLWEDNFCLSSRDRARQRDTSAGGSRKESERFNQHPWSIITKTNGHRTLDFWGIPHHGHAVSSACRTLTQGKAACSWKSDTAGSLNQELLYYS